MRRLAAAEVSAIIADAIIGEAMEPSLLGDVTLHPHQVDAVGRLRRLIALRGGALLADDVGMGKTFVALAVARAFRRVLVVAPAALRDTWLSSAAKADVTIVFASVQSLAYACPPGAPFDLVVFDEAHHLKSRKTRRFANAVALARSAAVLLMTATPIQNALDDLRAVLSLFLGTHAFVADHETLACYIVRRRESDLPVSRRPALPRVSDPIELRAVSDVDCLDRILALPPPLAPVNAGDAGILLTYTLARQWASSRAALRGALYRRLARARAMEDALLAGRIPSASELAAWCFADGAQQLTFPELVASNVVTHTEALLAQVRAHASSVRQLLQWIDAATDPDAERARILADVLARHPDGRVVAFSEYADTVASLYKSLSARARVGMLTHRGARVAGGRMSRAELLRQFGPGGDRTPVSERVGVLLTTDLLSEGVDLQQACVVVHLDLSWNPARLEQRVGRLRRLGSAHRNVTVYVMPPPASAERLLQLDRRLRTKVGIAAGALGIAGAILPGLAVTRDGDSAREERIACILRSWQAGCAPAATIDECVVAATRASRAGAIACVQDGRASRLFAVHRGSISDSRAEILMAMESITGCDVPLDADEAQVIHDRIMAWIARGSVANVVSLPEVRLARARRVVLQRVDRIGQRTPRHAQPQLAPFIRAARSAAAARLSAGAERVLDELAAAALGDDAWLHAMREFAMLHVDQRPATRLVALLLLCPDQAARS